MGVFWSKWLPNMAYLSGIHTRRITTSVGKPNMPSEKSPQKSISVLDGSVSGVLEVVEAFLGLGGFDELSEVIGGVFGVRF